MPEEQYNNETRSRLQAVGDFFWELAKVIILSVAIIVPIRYFLFQPFYVRGASMEPNFFDHEYLIIDEISYGMRVPFTEIIFPFGQPTRGEIVVFRYPRDPRQFFIKRIIGLPGETVVLSGGTVLIENAAYPKGRLMSRICAVLSRAARRALCLDRMNIFSWAITAMPALIHVRSVRSSALSLLGERCCGGGRLIGLLALRHRHIIYDTA